MSEPAKIEQWVFTFDASTGEVCRVEKLDPLSGTAQEISESEYAALDGYLPDAAADRELRLKAAYLQGMADCAAFYRRRLLG